MANGREQVEHRHIFESIHNQTSCFDELDDEGAEQNGTARSLARERSSRMFARSE